MAHRDSSPIGVAALSMPAEATENDHVSIAVFGWMCLGFLSMVFIAVAVHVFRLVRRRLRRRHVPDTPVTWPGPSNRNSLGARELYLPSLTFSSDSQRSESLSFGWDKYKEKDSNTSASSFASLQIRVRPTTRERDSALCRAIGELSYPGPQLSVSLLPSRGSFIASDLSYPRTAPATRTPPQREPR